MIYAVHVKTNKKEASLFVTETTITCDLTEKPKENKANIELLKILKRHFGREVRIVKGLKSKRKIVVVSDGA